MRLGVNCGVSERERRGVLSCATGQGEDKEMEGREGKTERNALARFGI